MSTVPSSRAHYQRKTGNTTLYGLDYHHYRSEITALQERANSRRIGRNLALAHYEALCDLAYAMCDVMEGINYALSHTPMHVAHTQLAHQHSTTLDTLEHLIGTLERLVARR